MYTTCPFCNKKQTSSFRKGRINCVHCGFSFDIEEKNEAQFSSESFIEDYNKNEQIKKKKSKNKSSNVIAKIFHSFIALLIVFVALCFFAIFFYSFDEKQEQTIIVSNTLEMEIDGEKIVFPASVDDFKDIGFDEDYIYAYENYYFPELFHLTLVKDNSYIDIDYIIEDNKRKIVDLFCHQDTVKSIDLSICGITFGDSKKDVKKILGAPSADVRDVWVTTYYYELDNDAILQLEFQKNKLASIYIDYMQFYAE